MREEEIRKIVRDEMANECFRESGIYDSGRQAAFNMLKPIIDCSLRCIRDDLREEFRPEGTEDA